MTTKFDLKIVERKSCYCLLLYFKVILQNNNKDVFMHPEMLKLINSMQEEQAGMYSNNSNALNNLLDTYSPIESALNFTSLLLHPDYQSTAATLEKAIHTCLGICNGNNVATKSYIKNKNPVINMI